MSGFVAREDDSHLTPPNHVGEEAGYENSGSTHQTPSSSEGTEARETNRIPALTEGPKIGQNVNLGHAPPNRSASREELELKSGRGLTAKKQHTRSASHVGILRNADSLFSKDQSHNIPLGSTAGAEALPFPPHIKGHQRAFSHGQMNDGKGHKREGSKTDFILPEGHEQRERQRELRPNKVSLKRLSLKRRGHSREASRTESVYTIRNQKLSLLRKICFWRKNTIESCTRLVVPNHVVPDDVTSSAHPNSIYPRNRICTTKYTMISFLPKNLFEQFHRFANLYFLFIVLLNFVPSVNAFAKELAVLPLIFVLGVTAIKDAFEDQRRRRSDQRVNNNTCRVYSSLNGRYVKVTWAELRVGDVIHLSCDEMIPADVVVLNTSDDQGVCYVESSNLDGETSLKQRQSVRGIGMDNGFDVSKFDNVLEVGPPTTKIYHFVGSIPIKERESIPLTKDNLILRDCVVKNTDFVEGIVVYAGRDTKALLNNGGTRYKRSKLERQMNKEVVWCVVILVLIALLSATGSALWQSMYTDEYPFGLIPFLIPSFTLVDSLKISPVDQSLLWVAFNSFWTFIIIYQVLIPISLYVTIEIIKVMQVYHIHHDPDFHDPKTNTNINCRALNIAEELGQVQYVFSDKTGTLTENNMVFQRCSVNGVDYHHDIQVAQSQQDGGSDSFVLNQELQEELNAIEVEYIYSQPGRRQQSSRAPPSSAYKASHRLLDFLFTMAACNTVVVAKRPHKDQMNASGMIIQPEEKKVTSNSSPLHSVPLIRTLFPSARPLSPIAASPASTPSATPDSSPKQRPHPVTFTKLTPFSMSKSQPHKPEITLRTFETLPEDGSAPIAPPHSNLPHSLGSASMALPQSNLPHALGSAYNGGRLRPTDLPISSVPPPPSRTPSPATAMEDMKPIYEAESPDELALVDAACRYGVRLLRRNLNSVVVSLPGAGVTEFEVLHVLPFDSSRKRMSVIVAHPDTGEIILYCKGADSAILDSLCPRPDEEAQLLLLQTQQHLQKYSQKGLRVLCMAKRVLSWAEYEEWARAHKQAENSLASRDRKLMESYNRIETNMHLTGATGIEDRLQDGVCETVSSLRQAGIKVWVLTGDKQETAINIAYACNLFTQDMEIIKLNGRSKDQTEHALSVYLQQIEEQGGGDPPPSQMGGAYARNSSERGRTKKFGLVVDGRTLVYILDRRANLKMGFLRLASACAAVMCCRATPLQKGLMVKSAKDKLKVLTLAIGDGANDVSMIQTADVGVGISGVEGRQAVMSSDFAITRFRHLQKLLLVHGHWCYDRLCRTILYFFYKNAFFVFLLMWYQMFCGYSTAVMIDDLYLVCFNLFFTSLPPIAFGIYDQDAPESLLMTQPELYAKTREGTVYTKRSFWVNIVDAVYQSIVLFFVAVFTYYGSDAGVYEFGMTITHSCLLTQLLHISIETKSWTVIHLASILVSYIIYFIFGIFYTEVCSGCTGLPSQYGELFHMVASPQHWFCVFVSVVLALLPRFVTRVVQATIWPDAVTQAVSRWKNVNHGHFVEKVSRNSSVTSSYRRKMDTSSELAEDGSDVTSSLVTMTTVISANEEEETDA